MKRFFTYLFRAIAFIFCVYSLLDMLNENSYTSGHFIILILCLGYLVVELLAFMKSTKEKSGRDGQP